MTGICNLLCFITIAVASNTVTATNYCNVASCLERNTVHTMCKYPSSIPAAACGQSYKYRLDDDEKKTIVDTHNQLRRKVASGEETRGNPGPQPAAVSMPDLTWDDELETVAQRWANQCKFEHDKCSDVERFAVGQNIATISTSDKTNVAVKDMIQLWHDEVAKFDKNKVDEYKFDSATRNYTQIGLIRVKSVAEE